MKTLQELANKVKNMFPNPAQKIQKGDEFWTHLNIEKALYRNGIILERARRRNAPDNSLTYVERMIIYSVRQLAFEHQFTRQAINGIEMEGERDKNAVYEPIKVKARFAFYNFGEYPSNPMPEFHVLSSNHPALVPGGNYSLLDFDRTCIRPPRYPSYDKWVKQGRPVFRGI